MQSRSCDNNKHYAQKFQNAVQLDKFKLKWKRGVVLSYGRVFPPLVSNLQGDGCNGVDGHFCMEVESLESDLLTQSL